MRLKRYRVRWFGAEDVVILDSKELLSVRETAKHLGISVETLRRWIRNFSFPPSYIQAEKGRADYWLRIDVMEYQKAWLRHPLQPLKKAKFQNLDQIDREEASSFSVLPLDRQMQTRRLDKMLELFRDDPVAFRNQHPNLKRWIQDKQRKRAN